MAKINRRNFLLGAGVGAGAVAGGLYYAMDAIREANKPKPNILLMIFDDMGFYLGSSKHVPAAKTPNLDALAARGVVFDRAYCPAPLCNPSRTALLTGVPPYKSGVYYNDEPWRASLPDAVTMPEYFSKHGYKTYGGGKIFHVMRGGPQFEDLLYDERFEKPNDPVTQAMYHTPMRLGPLDCEDEDMGDYKVATWAARRVKRPAQDPWFMTVGFFRPHGPLYTPRKYFEMYPIDQVQLAEVQPNDLDDVPPLGRETPPMPGEFAVMIQRPEERRILTQAYLAACSFADMCAGRVLDSLKRGPHAENTIVIICGDNGMSLGQKDRWFKSTLWDEATGVPLIISAPGATPGQRCSRVVSLQDLYPTLIDLCRLPPREDIAGRSIRPLLKNPARGWDYPAISVMGKGDGSVKTEDWTYIRYRDGSEELYDLRKDPFEHTNIASHPDAAGVKAKLAKVLPEKWADEAPRIEKEKW